MECARRVAHRIALRVANIDQHRRLLVHFLVGFFYVNTFKAIHKLSSLYTDIQAGGETPWILASSVQPGAK